MEEEKQAPTREVEALRENLDALHRRVLDIVATTLAVKKWRRTAVAVSVLAIAVIGTGLYYNVATHHENHQLANIAKLNAQVDVDFNNTIACLAKTPAVQPPCERKGEHKLFADEANLEDALS